MVRYTWGDEGGELARAYMALIGGAVGIRERAHFTLHLGVARLSQGAQRAIGVFNAALIVAFGVLVAWHAWGLSLLNTQLTSPALEINLAWLYGSAGLGVGLSAVSPTRPLRAPRRGHWGR